MHSPFYWIETSGPSKLAIMARPRAGEWLKDEIAHWKRSSVGIVISLLERDEVEDLGLTLEADLCRDGGIDLLSSPFPTRTRNATG